MMKNFFYYLTLTLYFLFINSCTEEVEGDEPTNNFENVDLSVVSQVNRIYFENQQDLSNEIEAAIIFDDQSIGLNNYVKEILISDDNTSLTASIYLIENNDIYIDNQLNNNSITIELINVESQSEFEDDNFDVISQEAMDIINTTFPELCNFDLNNVSTLNIPVQLHRVRLSNSGSIISQTLQSSIISRLNEEFLDAKLNFYYCGNINYIENSDLYEVDFDSDRSLFNQYETSDVLNIFVVGSINGLSQAGFAEFPFTEIENQSVSRLVITRFSLNTPTLIHETGHYFSLYHTFENSVNVLSNCMSSSDCFGDGICSTPLSTQVDENNAEDNSCDENISSVVRNFMSYGGSCRNRFDQNNEQLVRVAFSAREHRDFSDCGNNTNQSSISLSSNIDFPNTQINTDSSPQILTISNTGNASFDITGVATSNSAFTVLNPQSLTLQPNGSVNIQIQFTPTIEQDYNATISVNNNADNANSSNSSIQVTGTGIDNNSNTSVISLSGNLDFPDTEIGSTSQRTFIIQNTGNQNFNVSSIVFPTNVYSANWSTGTINAGGSQTVSVTFQPTNQQSYSGTVNVNNNADSGNGSISISGTGIDSNTGQPNLRFFDSSIEDDNNNNNGVIESGEDIDYDIVIENFGDGTATGVEVIIDTADSDITIIDNDRLFDDIPQGGTQVNSGAFDFLVSSSCPTKTVTFTMQINSNEGSWTDSFTIDIQGQNGGNPQVDLGNNTPRNSCSDTNSSNNYKLDLNTIYYKQNWDINGLIAYGSDGYRGMWYRFETTNSGLYNIGVSFNGNAGFQLFSSCTSTSPIITSNNSSGGAETAQINLSANTEYYLRFYDINDNNPVNLIVTIENN